MNQNLSLLLGGSALLVYSMEALSKSVEYLAGSRFRVWLNAFASNRLAGVFLGLILSVVLSSSGAVTVMLVGLANAKLLSLSQILSVTLGASVGTTFIVQLVAFRLTEFGLIMIALGVAIGAVARTDEFRHVGQGLFLLGLMFFSMKLLMDAGASLEQDEFFQYTLSYFRDRPIVSLLISAVFTAMIHSSAATIAFVMSLMSVRQANVYEALPWILGANLGTTATAFLASLRGGVPGKQAALGNLVSKTVGVALCYPLMNHLGQAVAYLASDVSRQIAHAHTLFNLLLAVIFFPFISLGVRVVRYFIPDEEKGGPFSFQYLDPRSLSTPEFALAQAQREILRLSDVVEQMVAKCIRPFETQNSALIEELMEMDQVVDYLNKGIKLYLTKLSQKEMTPEQVQKEFELLLRTNDLENIGDIIDKNILALIKKNIKKGYVFSKEGWGEITAFHEKVVQVLKISTNYFNTGDRALAAKLLLLYQEIDDMMIDLSEQHVYRLHRGIKESLHTTSVHLDLLGYLQRIGALATNFTRVHGLKSETQL
ncbi:MAG: Na/Pi cotransporter family protein [Deltaproteobacteria bacterium]|nr:Na/Pi cotransporter family protein [Deltaproteobacteria bacterium]